jgi:hypothetical protein
MVSRKTGLKIRKMHRYLGIFLGVQFLFWTVSGLYFSWTDIDQIHGDHYRILPPKPVAFDGLLSPQISFSEPIVTLELRNIAAKPHYWINNEVLIDARSGKMRSGITAEEAIAIAAANIRSDYHIVKAEAIHQVGPHHEYRDKPLPAFELTYDDPNQLKAYVSIADGKFQTVRHRSWRWFDFLWMTHTMDYKGRDDFNTLVLRIFSLMGFITVLSGFALWMVSTPLFRKRHKG